MLCPKCHRNIPDTAAFCNVCGTPLNQNKPGMVSASLSDVISKEEWASTMTTEEAKTEAPKEPVKSSVSSLFDAREDNHHDAEPTYNPQAEEYVHTYTKLPEKKKSPVKLIVTIVAILAVIGVAAVFCVPLIKNMFMSPVNKYISTEAKVFRSMQDEIYLYTKANHPDYAHVDTEISTTVSGNLDGVAEISALLSRLSFKATSDIDFVSDKVYSTLEVLNGGSSVAKLIAQQDDAHLSLQNEGSDKAFVTVAQTLSTANLTDDADYIEKFGVNKKAFDAYLLGAFDAAVNEALNDKNIIKDKAEFEGMSCKTVTFLVDASDVRSMMINLALYLEETPETKTILGAALMQAYEAADGIPAKDADEAIQYFADMIKREAGSVDFTEQYKYKVYYNGSTIVNRSVVTNTHPNDELSLATYSKAGSTIVKFTVRSEGTEVLTTFDYTSSKNALIGGITTKTTLDGESFELVNVKFNINKNVSISGINAFSGNVIVNVTTPDMVGLNMSMTATGDVQENVNVVDANLSVRSSTGENMNFAVNAKNTITPQADMSKISVPTSGNAEIEEVLEEFVESLVYSLMIF